MAAELDRLPRTLSLTVHELRTPLTVASGYVRMLLRQQAGDITDKQRTMLEETARACARVGALMAEMSELGALEAGEVSIPDVSFDLAALLVELGSSMLEGRDRGIRLEVRATRPVLVTGDRARLAAALAALTHAALLERGGPGVIIVECSTFQDTNREWTIVTIGDETVTRSLVDAVRATPPAFDEWRGGLGLSLPVGRRVIEAHGGALWSAPGGAPGAGSALRLPVAM